MLLSVALVEADEIRACVSDGDEELDCDDNRKEPILGYNELARIVKITLMRREKQNSRV